MLAGEPDIRELMYNEMLWNILFSKQKSGVSRVSRDLGPLVLLLFLNFSATSALVSYELVSYI